MAFMAKHRAQRHYNAGTRILVNLAPSSSPKEDHMRAVNHLQRAVELDPNFAYGFHNLAHAWYKLAEHEYFTILANSQYKNMKDFDNAIDNAFENGHADMVDKIREQYLKEHERDGFVDAYFLFALQAVDRALEIQYEFPQAHNTRGMVLAKMYRLDEALEATEVALSQAPDYKNASENRDKFRALKSQLSTNPDDH